MEYPSYPEYRNINLKNTVEIPAHWEACKLKFMAGIKNGRDYKHIETDDGYDVIGSGGAFAKASEYLFDGVSVLFGRKGTIDTPLFVNKKFWTVDTMLYTDIYDNTIPKYLYYCAVILPYKLLATQTALPSMTQSDLDNFLLTYPTMEEQQKIANFLDYKTQQIDQLIEKKKTLIEKLNEQRIAVITQAVTKGIDKNAKMKPSCVDWLGDVPEHWEVRRLKFVASHNDETLSDKTDPDYEIEYIDISSVDLVQGIKNIEPLIFAASPSRARRIVKDGDTIVSTVRTYLKSIATIDNPPNNMIVSTGFAVIRPKEEIYKKYMSYFLQSEGFVDAVVAHSVGVSYPAINASDLICLSISFPCAIEEQKKIVVYIEKELAQIDKLTSMSEQTIKYYQEYRSSLITVAVTGKIDVRKFQLPQAQKEVT